jgi:hypothetical protein
MTKYLNVGVNISEGQREKIKKAMETKSPVSIRLEYSDLNGEHVLAFTQTQLNKMKKAYKAGTGLMIKMSKSQLEHNAKVEGGFISAILPFLTSAAKFLIPSLATGAMSGLGSAAATKIVDKISGSGSYASSASRGGSGVRSGSGSSASTGSGVLYVKRGGMVCKIQPVGNGLYLSPWSKGNSIAADGLYMKTSPSGVGSGASMGYADGSGLLLGPDSPFSNIPILGMLL